VFIAIASFLNITFFYDKMFASFVSTYLYSKPTSQLQIHQSGYPFISVMHHLRRYDESF